MRINGGWFESDERLPQPVVIGQVETADDRWIECPFLIDTGADTSVLSAKVLRQLGHPVTLAPKQLGGIGGAVETWQVWTALRFSNTGGAHGVIRGAYSAFQVEGALEMSVLGYDVLHLFAVIVDRPGDTVCLMSPPHGYTIQNG
ncbi:MAG: aspartyl protease family protein [Planctomycetes bacterium]|nr:aspartyl protease family protein [Planctomycetota bacterium]